MSTTLATALGLALTLGPASDSPSVELEFDLGALSDDVVTKDIHKWLLEDETKVLADGGITIAEDAPHTIRVAVRRYGEGDIHYEATVTLREGDEAEPKAERTVTCEACSETELVAKVVNEVARVSGLIVYDADPQPETADPAPGTENAGTGSDGGENHGPAPRAMGGLGYAGIGIGAAGLATAIAGGVYLARGDRVVGDDGSRLDLVEHNRRLGAPLLGVGIGAFVVGAIMVGVDVGRRAKQRKAKNNQPVGIQVRPGFTGVTLRGRF